jgi:two-component system LytT family response regulator
VSVLRVIVADDELQARKRVTRLLEQMPGIEVVGACQTAEEVLAALPAARADVLLLDISMPGLDGLEAAALLDRTPAGASPPAVIFVTAHPQHAVEAFELGALDYVLKPVTAPRLAKAIARARQVRPAAAVLQRIGIETRQGIVLVDPAEVVCARFDGALVTVSTARDSWVTTMTLKDLEEKFPGTFERVDRRHLLNLAAVVRLEPSASGGYTAITHSGLEVPVSRQVGRTLRARLGI